MKRFIFLTNRLPFPKVDGRKNILLQYIKTIKKIYPDSEIINLSFVDNEEYIVNKPSEIKELITLTSPNFWEKIFNIIIYTLLLRKWPIQVSVYYSRKTHKRISELIHKYEPDYILIDMIRMSEYVKKDVTKFNCKIIMNFDDLLSLRYERQMKFIDFSPSIIGGYGAQLPRFIRNVLDAKLIKKILLKIESRLVKNYENSLTDVFDYFLFTSPLEARIFKKKIKNKLSFGIPMIINKSNSIEYPRKYDQNKIVFVGKMDVPHNISGVKYFIEKIWPKIKEKNKDAKFYIIGRNPVAELFELQKRNIDIQIVGEVENLESTIMDAAVMVVPLLYGTGIKTKIIEAMALGIPVVTNSIGAEGINIKNGEEMIVEDSECNFANAVVSLMKNQKQNDEISLKAKRYVEKYFTEDSVARVWEELINS